MADLTGPQQSALRWLYNRGTTGVFNKHGVAMAAGELAGVMRSTWNALSDAGMLIIGGNTKRIVMTEKGKQECLANPRVQESDCVVEDDD